MDENQFDELDWEAVANLLPVDVVVMTAVVVELTAVRSRLQPLEGKTKVIRTTHRESTYYIGRVGLHRCAVSMSDAGSTGRDGSALALNDAIARLRPAFTISVGIAFGKDETKQLVGDVLVSTQIIPYESERRGVNETVPRAPQPEAGQVLLNRARHLDADEPKLRMKFGPLLSGEKLVDDPGTKAELFAKHPKAIGGEMEAAGIYAAAARHRLEWLVMKAICDWADGHKNDEHQKLASSASALALERLLSRKGLERVHFEPYERAPVFTDLERRVGPTLEEIFKQGKEHTQKLAFEAAASSIRQADRTRFEATQRLHAVIETFRKEDGSLKPPEPSLLARVLDPLTAARDAALEAWLNAYNDASVRYVDGSLHASLFEETFGQEIRELVEIDGPQRARLHPRASSSFQGIWRAYDKLPKARSSASPPAPLAAVVQETPAAASSPSGAAVDMEPRDLPADDALAISLQEARASFTSRMNEGRIKQGITSYMLLDVVPRAGRFPSLSHAALKDVVSRSRVILHASEFMYPWLVDWLPNRTDLIEATSARDFPPMAMMVHRSGGLIVERTFTEDVHWPNASLLVPGRLVREVATAVLFVRNIVDAVGLTAIELGFSIIGANRRHFRFDVESYRVQRPYAATEDIVRDRRRVTAASLREEPLVLARSMSEALLSLFNFENSQGLIDDVLEPIGKLK